MYKGFLLSLALIISIDLFTLRFAKSKVLMPGISTWVRDEIFQLTN